MNRYHALSSLFFSPSEAIQASTNGCKKIRADPRDNPEALRIAHHRVGFPAPCLSIRKDGPVISLQSLGDNILPQVLIDLLLGGVDVVAVVVGKGFRLCLLVGVEYFDGLVVHLDDVTTASSIFLLAQRSAPHRDLDVDVHRDKFQRNGRRKVTELCGH